MFLNLKKLPYPFGVTIPPVNVSFNQLPDPSLKRRERQCLDSLHTNIVSAGTRRGAPFFNFEKERYFLTFYFVDFPAKKWN